MSDPSRFPPSTDSSDSELKPHFLFLNPSSLKPHSSFLISNNIRSLFLFKRNRIDCSPMSNSPDRADMEGDSTASPYLPPDVLYKILEFLPVKSLLRFRSVSKSWYSFISSPLFVKSHLNVSAKNPKVLLCSDTRSPFELKSCSLSSLKDQPSVSTFDILSFDSYLYPFHTFRIVGSLNGLICVKMCVKSLSRVYLWNPSTKKCKLLPYPDVDLQDPRYTPSYGFGYDDSTDNYKVVGVFCGTINGGFKSQVWVYTMRAGSWRKIQDIPTVRHVGGDVIFANGALYWEASPVIFSDPSFHIFSLDLREESYRLVPQPRYAEGLHCWSMGALNGFLAVSCVYESHLDIWIMNNNGASPSWVKVLHLKDATKYIMASGTSKIGQILLKSHICLMLFNSSDNTFKDCEILNFAEGVHLSSYLHVDPYLESLVSPMPEIELNRQLHE